MGHRHWKQMQMQPWYVIGFSGDGHELILLASGGEHFWRLENDESKRVGKATHIPLDGINEAKRWAEDVMDGVVPGFVDPGGVKPLDIDEELAKKSYVANLGRAKHEQPAQTKWITFKNGRVSSMRISLTSDQADELDPIFDRVRDANNEGERGCGVLAQVYQDGMTVHFIKQEKYKAVNIALGGSGGTKDYSSSSEDAMAKRAARMKNDGEMIDYLLDIMDLNQDGSEMDVKSIEWLQSKKAELS